MQHQSKNFAHFYKSHVLHNFRQYFWSFLIKFFSKENERKGHVCFIKDKEIFYFSPFIFFYFSPFIFFISVLSYFLLKNPSFLEINYSFLTLFAVRLFHLFHKTAKQFFLIKIFLNYLFNGVKRIIIWISGAMKPWF